MAKLPQCKFQSLRGLKAIWESSRGFNYWVVAYLSFGTKPRSNTRQKYGLRRGVIRLRLFFNSLALVCLSGSATGLAGQEVFPLVKLTWFEARTVHFHTYSCGSTQAVAKIAARLEQFHAAYSSLAGAQAVTSPPIVVIAFPDHSSLREFVPFYQGQPSNLSGFFHRASDENLIVLSLTANVSGGLNTIFHEFAHLLLRHNERIWPMWLSEGMADIYATFEVTGDHAVRIGKPQDSYLQLLAREPLIPLWDLFAVTQESPQYNEREHQGIFYAESWLLTHYLMIGPNSARRPRLAAFTALLRSGQSSEQAFTNAFQVSLPVMERELQQYLKKGNFEPLGFAVSASLTAAQLLTWRRIGPAEICFHLGDELLRVGRIERAETYFLRGKSVAPASPLPFEGLGFLAAEREDRVQAIANLQEALHRGSTNFLAHYILAREKFRLSQKTPHTYSRLEQTEAEEIRKELEKAFALMPNFAPAHHLLGFLELVQGEDAATAEHHLQQAVHLEPENQSYSLTLAQAQLFRKEFDAARATLLTLCLPNVEPPVRHRAEEILKTVFDQERNR